MGYRNKMFEMNFDTPYYDGVFVSVNKMYCDSEKNTQYIG
jgi:hypothetical protein